MARFLHMAVDYKQKIGFTGQFLIEPKPAVYGKLHVTAVGAPELFAEDPPALVPSLLRAAPNDVPLASGMRLEPPVYWYQLM